MSLFDCDFSGPVALVLGGEESGLRKGVANHCEQLVRLPMHGEVSSLNVSVAAGICLYEVLRQRRKK
jgi:23S rRNA (guanosine2251-2'-O)-methyltransferase